MLLQFLLEKLLFFLSFPSFPSQTQPGCFYSRAWTPEQESPLGAWAGLWEIFLALIPQSTLRKGCMARAAG